MWEGSSIQAVTVLFGEGLYLGILPLHGEEAGLLGLNLGGFFSITFCHPLLSQNIIFAFGGSGVCFFLHMSSMCRN